MVANSHLLLPPVSLIVHGGTIKVQPASLSSASPYGQLTLAQFVKVFASEIMLLQSLCTLFKHTVCRKDQIFTYVQQAFSQGNQRT